MYCMISRLGDVWMFGASGRGKKMASGVRPVGSTCGSLTTVVTRFSGISCRDCDGFLLGVLGLGRSVRAVASAVWAGGGRCVWYREV